MAFLLHVLCIDLVEAQRAWGKETKQKGMESWEKHHTCFSDSSSCPLSEQEAFVNVGKNLQRAGLRDSEFSGYDPAWHSTRADVYTKCTGVVQARAGLSGSVGLPLPLPLSGSMFFGESVDFLTPGTPTKWGW